jgi:hypothetical protein
MKALRLAITLTATTLSIVSGGDVEHGSSERFKVSYVETEELPPLTVISKELDDRKEALDEDERHVAEGLDAARLTMNPRSRSRVAPTCHNRFNFISTSHQPRRWEHIKRS